MLHEQSILALLLLVVHKFTCGRNVWTLLTDDLCNQSGNHFLLKHIPFAMPVIKLSLRVI